MNVFIIIFTRLKKGKKSKLTYKTSCRVVRGEQRNALFIRKGGLRKISHMRSKSGKTNNESKGEDY